LAQAANIKTIDKANTNKTLFFLKLIF